MFEQREKCCFDRVYLDWNATSPLLDVARQSFVNALELIGNPSSVHREGRKVRLHIEEARCDIADFCGAKPENVIFTSGATEAANFVLTPDFYKGRQQIKIRSLFVSAIEHPSVYTGGRFFPDQIHQIPVLPEGIVDLLALSDLLSKRNPSLGIPMVAVMLVNNETGVVQPIREISKIIKKHEGILVVDAVQAAGRMSIAIETIGADFLILSSHKIGAPVGAGALVFREENMLPNHLLRGGDQERGYRAGTENLAAICGFSAAVKVMGKDIQERSLAISKLRDYLEEGLRILVPDITIHGRNALRVSNTCFFTIPSIKAEVLQIALDLEGIAVSAGAACSSGKLKKNHVLTAMGCDSSQGALRVSLGFKTTQEDVDSFLKALNRTVHRNSS
ncbi:cysteine desulfurase family protein [Candidatus Liberibacter sp.]|uniref:cysteine desulfurase family protein n=1 Tax=Candidatus Liberibacter sp. TaxID=34022 RepID=UPI0015F65129|nr:cysteine desulfurase family protein [Candidatus Liberibacter sp.]MBA5723864.1 cysteine desulfurase [Candidatus Liberibacter sp.]